MLPCGLETYIPRHLDGKPSLHFHRIGESGPCGNKGKREGSRLLRWGVELSVCLWHLEGTGWFFSH